MNVRENQETFQRVLRRHELYVVEKVRELADGKVRKELPQNGIVLQLQYLNPLDFDAFLQLIVIGLFVWLFVFFWRGIFFFFKSENFSSHI